MATLTDEQTDFLKSHHIPLDKTFDASGLSSKEYKAKMKENGTLVAYGVPPCQKGHTLRNKQANCLQCNPQAVASIKRQATAGDIYMAVSASQLLTKISVVEDATDIEQQLNQQNHAGINDWQLAMTGHTQSMGQVENHLQQRLASSQVPKKLIDSSKVTKASAIYDVDILDALEIVNEIPFQLTTIDNAVLDSFHARYTDRQLQKQQLAEQQAAEEIEREQQKQAEQERLKQQKISEQKQLQQQAKQQKLAQKQQRQQQIEDKKQQKLQQRQNRQLQNSQPVELSTNKPTNNQIATHSSKAEKFGLSALSGQKNLTGIIAAIVVLVIALILSAIAYVVMK